MKKVSKVFNVEVIWDIVDLTLCATATVALVDKLQDFNNGNYWQIVKMPLILLVLVALMWVSDLLRHRLKD